MEKQLREQLLEDEQLLWAGRPESFDTLDRTNKTGIIVGLVIKALVALGLLIMHSLRTDQDGRSSHG